MKLIDLISQLQALYNTYDDEYKETMGEPEIVIDVFDRLGNTHTFEYGGFTKDIVIEKTDCGTYDILSKFHENCNKDTKTKELFGEPWPYPEVG